MKEKELLKKEKEIIELQKTIKDLNNKLTESESLKSNFISNIMNEVYNPFSSILSIADNITTLKESNIHQATSMAEIIYREAVQLDFQLKNIFTAAKIEAGLEDIELSNINLNSIIELVTKKFQYDISNKNLELISNLTKTDNFNIKSDQEKIILILSNLLSNSIKYSPKNAIIEFEFELVEGYLNISLSDHGPGMSDSEMELIFDRFKRVDETINSVTGGTGLGLSIVKALTEILNGNINFSNDNGTKVLLSIPNMANSSDIDSIDDDDILFDEELF